jgi:hypothetical protein
MSDRRSLTRRVSLALSVVTLTGCFWLVAPTAARADARDPAKSVCTQVTADIQPHHPHVGDTLSPSASWVNCGDRSEFIHTRFVFNGTCIQAFRERGHLRLPPGGGAGEGLATTPACRGVYHVTVEAYHGGLLLDRATRVVRVKP